LYYILCLVKRLLIFVVRIFAFFKDTIILTFEQSERIADIKKKILSEKKYDFVSAYSISKDSEAIEKLEQKLADEKKAYQSMVGQTLTVFISIVALVATIYITFSPIEEVKKKYEELKIEVVKNKQLTEDNNIIINKKMENYLDEQKDIINSIEELQNKLIRK
jgi:hypothetical protein